MKIWLKIPYHLKTLWIFGGTEFEEIPKLHITSKKLKSLISISLDFESKKVEAVSQIEITNQLFEELSNQSKKNPEHGLPWLEFTSVQAEFEAILNEHDTEIKKVISLMRSRFHIVGIADDSIERDEPVYWSPENTKFLPLFCIKPAYIQLGQVITQHDIRQIQNDLDNDVTPFYLAFKFLNSAFNDDVPEFIILDATTAAELAIKEFLMRKNTDLEKILTELPSPPLPKLYGSILKHYSAENGKDGIKSPRLRILDSGNQLRNKIVHSPKNLDIPEKIAWFYRINVESAICHLLTLLYPEDTLWKSRYTQSYNFSPEDQSILEKEFIDFVKNIQKIN